MYQYTFDEETTNKIKNKTSNSNDLFNKFDEIDKKYDEVSNSKKVNLELEEMPYKTLSDDEIKSKAEGKLHEYKESKIDAINDEYNNKISAVDKNLENVSKNDEVLNQKLKDDYNAIKQNTENDAIKRGLARSSIIVNKIADLDKNMLSSLEKQRLSSLEKIDNLNEQKSLLEQQRQSALNSFDITYAIKLQDEIESLNDEINKQNQAALKYNNEIAQTIANWEKSQKDDLYNKTKTKLQLEDEYGSNIFQTLKQNEKYQIASEYFEGMSKEEALAELESNPIYKQNLGQTKYNRLIKEISQRD